MVWNGLPGTGWVGMCTFTGLEPHMGQPYLSVWSFILKKLMQAYSHVGCFPREQKQKLQDILRLRLRAYPESLLLHSVTQSHKASPYWMCGGEMIPDSWLEEPQGICGCWQYTTLLDREVNVSGLLPVIAKGRCLLECLANLYQLSIPITMTLKNLRKQCFLCRAMKSFLQTETHLLH